MEQAALVTRLRGLLQPLVTEVGELQQLVLAEERSPVASSLASCGDALSDLETFLTPGFITPPSGAKYSPSQCAALAKLTAELMRSTLPSLVQSLTTSLRHIDKDRDHGEDDPSSSSSSGGGSGDDGSDGGSSSSHASEPASLTTLFVASILSRALTILLFTFEHLAPQRPSGEHVKLLHDSNFLSSCCAALNACTASFQAFTPGSPCFLPELDDRLNLTLCGALLGSVLTWYSHAAQASRQWWSADCTDRAGDLVPGGQYRRSRPFSTHLDLPEVETTLFKLTETVAASVLECFYQRLPPLQQALLLPSLRLEDLVRAGRHA